MIVQRQPGLQTIQEDHSKMRRKLEMQSRIQQCFQPVQQTEMLHWQQHQEYSSPHLGLIKIFTS